MAYQSILNPMPVTGTLAVTGTFWQATQPVSGTVTVGNASLAVTGSFFQATQPVSIASMPSTPVTGTFFQTTQPVSIAATVAISAAALPLPSGASTETTLGLVNSKVVSAANVTSSGTLTASDAVVGAPVGDGTLISGASTAGSVVAMAVPDRMSSWLLLIKGYVSGAIYTEASSNSTNGTDGDWVEVKGRRTGTAPGTESVVYAMVANGYYRGNDAAFRYIRARLIGGTGATVRWDLSSAVGPVFLNSGIPGGSSNIGSVTVGNASLPVTGSFYQTTQPVYNAADFDLLSSVLTELRVISTMLQIGLSVKDEPSDLREDQARQLN